jgi:hypothetical protein
MATHERRPWPGKVVWFQDDVIHRRFYWLELPEDAPAQAGQKIVATVDGQTVRVEGDVPPGFRLRLSDALLDLDQPVIVQVNGRQRFSGKIPRTAAAMVASLDQRADPASAATAVCPLP